MRYGAFGGWEMAAGKVEVLLVVGGFDVDREVWKPDLSTKMSISRKVT